MKYKYIISVFIIGVLFWLFAAWSKITHQAFADLMFTISFGVIALSGVMALLKILFNKNDKFLIR